MRKLATLVLIDRALAKHEGWFSRELFSEATPPSPLFFDDDALGDLGGPRKTSRGKRKRTPPLEIDSVCPPEVDPRKLLEKSWREVAFCAELLGDAFIVLPLEWGRTITSGSLSEAARSARGQRVQHASLLAAAVGLRLPWVAFVPQVGVTFRGALQLGEDSFVSLSQEVLV